MPSPDATLQTALDTLAALEIADPILLAAGLQATYSQIPGGGLPDTNTYPCITHYVLPQGMEVRQITSQGGGGPVVLVPGQRQRGFHIGYFVAVGPRAVPPAQLAALEALARPWYDRMDDFFMRHHQLGGIVLQCLPIVGGPAQRPATLTLNDTTHYGIEGHAVIWTRPLPTTTP